MIGFIVVIAIIVAIFMVGRASMRYSIEQGDVTLEPKPKPAPPTIDPVDAVDAPTLPFWSGVVRNKVFNTIRGIVIICAMFIAVALSMSLAPEIVRALTGH